MAIATVRNMRRIAAVGRPGNYMAWSPVTGEVYSADPNDYWSADDETTLRDEEGKPMLLVELIPARHVPIQWLGE